MSYKNPDKKRQYQRDWLAKRRAEFFSGKCCVRCGSSDQLCLDHIDPSEKTSHRIFSWADERRQLELTKCQILCRACHVDKTNEDLQSGVFPVRKAAQCGSVTMYGKGCRCDECREAKRLHKLEYFRRKRLRSLA